MHTNKEQTKKTKAWEFVSVFPENEKGTYGRRIAESKWQSQTTSSPPPQFQSQPRPKVPPRSPNLGKRRPSSSPEVLATRAKYQPPRLSRHTIESSHPSTHIQTNRSQPKPRTPIPVSPSSPLKQQQQQQPQQQRQPQQRTRSSQTFSFFQVHKPVQQQDSSRNLYEQMRVDDSPSFYTPSAFQSYYVTDNSMSSSVIGSKSSTNLSRTCPLSSSDPSVQNFLIAENERQQGNHY